MNQAVLLIAYMLLLGAAVYAGLEHRRADVAEALADERLMELAATQGQLVSCTVALQRQSAAVDSLRQLGIEQALRLDSAVATSRAWRRQAEADARSVLAADVGASADSAAAWLLEQAPHLTSRYRR